MLALLVHDSGGVEDVLLIEPGSPAPPTGGIILRQVIGGRSHRSMGGGKWNTPRKEEGGASTHKEEEVAAPPELFLLGKLLPPEHKESGRDTVVIGRSHRSMGKGRWNAQKRSVSRHRATEAPPATIQEEVVPPISNELLEEEEPLEEEQELGVEEGRSFVSEERKEVEEPLLNYSLDPGVPSGERDEPPELSNTEVDLEGEEEGVDRVGSYPSKPSVEDLAERTMSSWEEIQYRAKNPPSYPNSLYPPPGGVS